MNESKNPVKAEAQQRNRGKFRPGQSGNPKGRAQGSKHKATLAAQALLDGEVEALTRKAIEKALEGDGQALRLCLERLLPPRKDRPVSVKLPKVEGAGDISAALAAILEAVAYGEITPDEAKDLSGIIETARKGIELVDLEARISALEKRKRR